MGQYEREFKKSAPDDARLTEDITFRTSPSFKKEIQKISEEYKIPISEMCRLALIRLVREEAKAAAGDHQ
jgi:hypothetical protein